MNRSRSTLLIGILAIALNLRPAVASVSPVLEAIRGSLGFSYTVLSLLTVVPTLCMGVFAFAVPTVTDRIGRERGVLWGLVLITVATATRLGSRHAVVLFASTFLVGVGIAVTQALLPSIVTEYFATRESFVTGLYTASLSIGATLAGGLTVPVAQRVGSWPAALAIWTIPAGIAVLCWVLSLRQVPSQRDGSPAVTHGRLPWRDRWAWVITLFFGGASSVFFFVVTWLPPRYVELGWSPSRAGFLLSIFVFSQLGGNLTVSAVGDRLTDQRPLFALMGLLTIGGSLGVTLVPRSVPWLWAACLGIGSAGLFTLCLTLPITYASSPAATDGLTAMMLGGGYLISALGPFVAGAIRDVTGGYTAAFAGLVVLGTALLGAGVVFGPDRRVIATRRPETA